MNRFDRSGTLVNRKFYHFLIPTVLSTIAISLNEFVDSIIVSNMLGSDAMSLVNMGYPVMLTFAVVYTLLGVGGSVVYAELTGKQEVKRAGMSFSAVILASLVIAVIISVLGIVFLEPISAGICRDKGLLVQFVPYMRVLVISGILIIPLQVLITFLPALGSPGVGTAINITANAVNLIMDYIYIRYFNTGLKGAAMATFTGYAAGLLLALVLALLKKVEIPFGRFGISEYKNLPDTILRGAAPALNQFGYCIKIAFCNNLAMSLAGIAGVSVFTLCMQTVSIMSIFIAGIIGAMVPIMAALNGQGDYKGVRILMKTALIMQFAVNLMLVAILEFFPGSILFIYNVKGDLVAPSIHALRIFSVMFIFRGFVMVFMYYFQVISRKAYAVIIGMIDGFAGIIPLALILSSFMGITGIWIAFPLLSVILLAGILIANYVISLRSDGRLKGILLYEYEEESIPAYDATVLLNENDIVKNAKALQDFCEEKLTDPGLSSLVAVTSEEMGIYTMDRKDKSLLDEIDLLVKIYEDNVTMDIRSVGKPFDITSSPAEEYSNIDVIRKIALSIDYAYVTGMNQTRIKIKR